MKNENKIKYLEFIQGVINRMASNSFMIKGWLITIIAAMFVLSAKESNIKFAYIAFIPTIAFWIIDGFYMCQERLYRELWKDVLLDKKKEFVMDASGYNGFKRKWKYWNNSFINAWRFTWPGAILSRTLIVFYLPLILIMLYIIKHIK